VEPDGSRRVHPLPDAFASAAILEAFRRAKSPDPGVRVAGVHLRTPPETTRPGAALRLAAGGDDIVDLVRELATLTGTARSERWREALVRISATPCPWLCGPLHEAVDALRTAWSGTEDESSALALAKMTAPTAGRVPLLVSERDHRRGRVLELRISRRADGTCGDPWEGAGPFALEARDAVLAAYDAAKSLTYTRGAPRELYGHRIDVLGIADPENCSIEGNSLALPAFLAFVSLWCDRPLDDVAATARPRAYDDGRPADDLGPVSGFPGKANALAEWAAGRPCRLLLHPACERVPALPAVERVDVRTWKDAAAAVGLLDTLADLEGTDAGDTPAIRAGKLEKLLTEFNDEVRNQDLGRHSCAGDSPWAVLATRMQDVLDELREGPARPSTDPETLARGSAYAALAYNYAGRDVPTKLLEGLSEEILQEVPEARLLRDVAALASAVSQDRRAEWDTLAQTLRSTLDALDKPARNRVGGMALGTLGRVHLHAGRIDLAVELLAEAVDHHARYAPHETPRSRCYHAAALRRADRLEESLEEIDRAVEELASVKYAAYRATTEMFLRYERARTLAAMNRLDDAARDLGSAEQAAKARGWGPRPGILRERVWIEKRRARAAEEGGRSAEAEAHRRRADELLAELDALLEPKSPGFLERIVAEAHADPRIDGEVY
jgi:tetratricopeptide (TPR) repeat protein